MKEKEVLEIRHELNNITKSVSLALKLIRKDVKDKDYKKLMALSLARIKRLESLHEEMLKELNR